MGKHLLHPKAMSSVIFFLDIVFSILWNIIGFFETTKDSAIAIIVLFSIAGLPIILPFSILVLKYSDHSTVGVVAWVIQIILAVGYYYGKYINGILIRYGTFLGCEEDCQRTNQFVALFSLLLAILFLNYVIPKLHAVIQKNSKKKHHTYEHYFFGVIAVCVNANAIFSTLSIIPADIQCTLYAVILSFMFLAVVTFVAAIKICIDYSEGDDDDDVISICPWCEDVLTVLFVFYSLSLLVPVYLVGNNQLPLEYFSCNFSGGGFVDTGRTEGHIVRLLFMTITAAAVLSALYKFWKTWKTRKKNYEPEY